LRSRAAGEQPDAILRPRQQHHQRRRRGLLRSMGGGDRADERTALMQLSRVQVFHGGGHPRLSHSGAAGMAAKIGTEVHSLPLKVFTFIDQEENVLKLFFLFGLLCRIATLEADTLCL